MGEKYRSGGELSGSLLAGEVRGCDVLIVDDMIGTGATMARTAAHCRREGAQRVFAVATHGLFVGEAQRLLGESKLDRILVSDTVPAFRLAQGALSDRLTTVATAGLMADAIRRASGGWPVPC